MGEFGGFITDKLEIKFLILYIADRLVQPAPFEMIQELAMCDKGVEYFDFADCMADLVRTGHLQLEHDKYAITQKGRENIRACESHLPYTVRLQVDKNMASFNNALRRSSLVTSKLSERPRGGYTLTLSLSDELDSLMQLTLLVTREDMAKALQRHFQADAEQIYSQILAVLFDHESGEKPAEGPET